MAKTPADVAAEIVENCEEALLSLAALRREFEASHIAVSKQALEAHSKALLLASLLEEKSA